ncbi:hypothetical protein DH2020_047837 [Rehmannia glutinosa]|uniref:Glucan endo-1,3-beta-D-glucosidase n=1 Tax=Rehmannia glutinosa TaxID=99300 RepID=A0ABR0U8D3_REHGL
MVVDLLLQNGIRHLKLFSPSDNVLKAFASSDIIITMTMPNEVLEQILDPGMASYWLQEKILNHVHIGSEPFSTYARNYTYDNAIKALRLIQNALVANKYNVTATTPHFTDVLKPDIRKPSEADFRPDLKDQMVELVRLLNRSNAPFSNFTVEDNGLVYRNVFEFVYDSFLHAFAKAGSPGLSLMALAWPMLRDSLENFYLILRAIKEPHCALEFPLMSNGEPKFKIDFTGQGRDIFPTTARGIILMPKRWCVFNNNTRNLTAVKEEFDLACRLADCTTLAPGALATTGFHLTPRALECVFGLAQAKTIWTFNRTPVVPTDPPSRAIGNAFSTVAAIHGWIFGTRLWINALSLDFPKTIWTYAILTGWGWWSPPTPPSGRAYSPSRYWPPKRNTTRE